MSELFERFTEFPDFVTPTQEQLDRVYSALRTMRSLRGSGQGIDEICRVLSEVDPYEVFAEYSQTEHRVRNGNRVLSQQLSSISFRHFKPIVGSINYV